jgi:hypothetical protein
MHRVILGATTLLATSAGLLTIWLVRPKNIAAELMAGIISGALASVACFTISWGWIFARNAGLPLGIWLGMLGSILIMCSVCVVGTLAAGMMLRRYGSLTAIIGPYFELVVPSVLTARAVIGMIYCLSLGQDEWRYYIIPMLLLPTATVSVVMQWDWKLRAAIHAAWLWCGYLLIRSFPESP